jgi:hypothetical protein
MNRIYTAAHLRFLCKKIPGRSYAEVTRLFNERFGLSKTEGAIKTVLVRNGFVNGLGTGNHNKKYTERHIKFLRDHVSGRSNAELAEMFNKKFNMSVDDVSIQNVKCKYGLYSGVNFGRFPKGHVPKNKGRKGYCAPGSEKGWFGPGHPGYRFNIRSIGSERVNVNGYVEVKVSDIKTQIAKERQKNWKAKHVVVWEKANGPVPKGHIVIFLDADKSHIVLKNLMMISREVHAIMAHLIWNTNDRELTNAIILLDKIKVATANLKRKSFKGIKNKKIVFLNNNGYKVYVIQEKERWISVRETRAGDLIRLRVKELRSKATRAEAQRDLYEYAAYYAGTYVHRVMLPGKMP